jgi:general secretion pathway protein J
MSGPRSTSGFTLVEVMIAMAIFAILAVISYRTLDSLFRTREHLSVETARLRDVALLFARLDDDLAMLMDRRVRTADNLIDDALRLSALLPGPDEASLVFTRAGFAGSVGATAAPQRIGYRLREGTIELVMWPALDTAPRSAPQAFPALRNVREAKWQALDRAGNWQDVWRSTSVGVASAPATYPAALRLNLTLASGEQYVRIFALRDTRS